MLAENAIIVSTSVLQTGVNPPPVELVLVFGHAYSVEALLQAAGRAGRSSDTHGYAILLSTPFAVNEALRIFKYARGLVEVRDLIDNSDDLQQSLAEYFDPAEILRVASSADDCFPQSRRHATHADLLILQRALQVFSVTLCLVLCCV
jgi:ERCC4-related helicase